MTTFLHREPPFYLSVVFGCQSPVGRTGSVCAFILTPAHSRFRVLNVRQVFLCIFRLLASLCGWIDVRTRVPQGVGWKTEFIHLECKEERKWERGTDEGRGVGLHLM